MDKEKEIEEICEIFETDVGVYRDDCLLSCKYAARLLVENGYRKAEEVKKETAKEILFYLKATITDGLLKNHEILNALMKEYDIEV